MDVKPTILNFSLKWHQRFIFIGTLEHKINTQGKLSKNHINQILYRRKCPFDSVDYTLKL
jgi:hypothetical protein